MYKIQSFKGLDAEIRIIGGSSMHKRVYDGTISYYCLRILVSYYTLKMYGQLNRANSPTPSLDTQSTDIELPELGRKRSKSEPRMKADWELEILIQVVKL